MTENMRKCIEEAERCELCGSRRGLEAHHIIPLCVGGNDSDENLLCVCQRCHAILTPRSVLTKIGKDNQKKTNIAVEVWKTFYEDMNELINSGLPCGIPDVFDTLDSVVIRISSKYGNRKCQEKRLRNG